MSTYAAYEPDEREQSSGDFYSLENQEKRYAVKLENLIEEEFPLKEIKKVWKEYKMIHRKSENSFGADRFEELKRDYKNYKKYLNGKLDKNPVQLKKGL